jgi:hypothetical protein
MDLSPITHGWSYHEHDEALNVRKVQGLDGSPKVQVRIENGVLQWELNGRPDGRTPYGCRSVLDYCLQLLCPQDEEGRARLLDEGLRDELVRELFGYYRRGRALLLLGEYRAALADTVHNLRILELIRRHCPDAETVYAWDRFRPGLLVDQGRSAMLLNLAEGDPGGAVEALTRAIEAVEDYYLDHELDEELPYSRERGVLIDLRRSLREKHNVALSDRELMRSLKAEQKVAIRRENYEMAARLRDRMDSLRQRIAAGR